MAISVTQELKKLCVVLIALILAAHKWPNWAYLVRMVRPKGLSDRFQSCSYPSASKRGQTAVFGLILALQELVYDFIGILTSN